MAKVIGPCLSIEAKNQLGKSIIFSTRNGKNIVRAFNVPKKVKTHAQELQRARYKNYREEWRYMELARKTVFNERAIEQNRISGYHQFLHENLDPNRKGQLYLDLSCIGLWHFNEESGSILYDGTRNHNNGNIQGVTRTHGKFNGALDFNGSSNYINCGKNKSFSAANAITIEAWVYSRNNTDYSGIVDYRFVFADNKGARLMYWHAEKTKLFLGNGTAKCEVVSNDTPPINEWIYIVGTWDGTTIKLYINGVKQTDETAFTGPILIDLDLAVLIGKQGGFYFDGVIDEVAIYNRAKTPAEIKASYDLA